MVKLLLLFFVLWVNVLAVPACRMMSWPETTLRMLTSWGLAMTESSCSPSSVRFWFPCSSRFACGGALTSVWLSVASPRSPFLLPPLFFCAVAFLFNWIGFFLSFCLTTSAAGRYGAVSGFGLSLIKWILIVRVWMQSLLLKTLSCP